MSTTPEWRATLDAGSRSLVESASDPACDFSDLRRDDLAGIDSFVTRIRQSKIATFGT
jgi:hypothetical protein